MALIGYARVSMQPDLRRQGVRGENKSGRLGAGLGLRARRGRPCRVEARPAWSLARSLTHLIETVTTLESRGVVFRHPVEAAVTTIGGAKSAPWVPAFRCRPSWRRECRTPISGTWSGSLDHLRQPCAHPSSGQNYPGGTMVRACRALRFGGIYGWPSDSWQSSQRRLGHRGARSIDKSQYVPILECFSLAVNAFRGASQPGQARMR
jgi:hypothetical protein